MNDFWFQLFSINFGDSQQLQQNFFNFSIWFGRTIHFGSVRRTLESGSLKKLASFKYELNSLYDSVFKEVNRNILLKIIRIPDS